MDKFLEFLVSNQFSNLILLLYIYINPINFNLFLIPGFSYTSFMLDL